MSDKASSQQSELMRAIGVCLMGWATVEMRISLIFNAGSGLDVRSAGRLWARIRSFEAKLQVLRDLLNHKLQPEESRDWTLLNVHILSLYALRNQVAHSTMIGFMGEGAETWSVKPFLSFGEPEAITERILGVAELEAYTARFQALDLSLGWFLLNVSLAPSQRPQPPIPMPDLILRLRTEDDRKREAQRHRALAWRQYLERNPDLKLD